MEWEKRVDAAETRNEVVLEGSDCFFGGVGAMDVWWHELELNGVGAEICFDCRGTLVVHDVHFWVVATGSKVGMEFGGGLQLVSFGFGF